MKKIIIFVLSAMFLAGVFVATATPVAQAALTQSQVDAIIALLQSFGADQPTIDNVRVALGGGAPPSWCHDFNVNLKIGDTGAEVDALHSALTRDGFTVNEDEKSTDSFGESTASAVSGFQEKYKDEILTPLGLQHGTGYAGPATRAKLNQLYRCGIIPPSTQPSITVVSPNGGESWQTGETRAIIWNTANINIPSETTVNVNLDLIWPGQFGTSSMLFGQLLPNTGQYQWIIPSSVAARQDYKIQARLLHLLPSGGITEIGRDQSDAVFSIGGAGTTQPSITVVSPNGGEQWQTGSTQTIRWSGESNNSKMQILLFPWSTKATTGPHSSTTTIATSTDNTGLFDWIVPSTIPADQYFVRIVCISNCVALSALDDSDAPFSIGETTLCTPNLTRNCSITISGQSCSGTQTCASDGSAWSSCVDNPGDNCPAASDLPDLVVSSISHSPISPSVGSAMSFTGIVRNSGAGAAGASQSGLYIDINNDGSLDVNNIPFQPTGSLAANATETETWFNAWTAVAGTHKYMICADVTAVVTEVASDVTNCASAVFTVGGAGTTQPSITVVSPNGGESWQTGETRAIIWNTANINIPSETTVNVNLDLIWPGQFGTSSMLFGQLLPNTGQYQWIIPSSVAARQDYKIQARLLHLLPSGGITEIGRDQSDAVFSIGGAGTGGTTATLTVSKIGTGTGLVTGGTGIHCGSDCSEVYASGAIVALTATPSTSAVFAGWSGGCSGTATTCAVSMNVSKTATATFNNASGGTPTGSITVTSPNGGESLQRGSTYVIGWQSQNPPANTHVKLHLLDAAGTMIRNLSGSAVLSPTGFFSWIIPADIPLASYKIEASLRDAAGAVVVRDQSDSTFNIVSQITGSITASPNPCSIPSGATTCSATINWSTTGGVTNTVVTVTGAGNPEAVFASSGASGSSVATWIQGSPNSYLFKLYQSFNMTPLAQITVTGTTLTPTGSITVTFPNGGESLQRGSTYVIGWQSQNPPANTHVKLHLLDAAGTMIRNLSGSAVLSPTGFFSWIIPADIPLASYKIEASLRDAAGAVVVRDQSDSTFNIVSQITGSITASPNPCSIPSGATTCSATINWSTTGGVTNSVITVTLSPGGSESIFEYSGASGSKVALIAGSPYTYLFKLYQAFNMTPLAQITVTGTASAASANISQTANILKSVPETLRQMLKFLRNQ